MPIILNLHQAKQIGKQSNPPFIIPYQLRNFCHEDVCPRRASDRYWSLWQPHHSLQQLHAVPKLYLQCGTRALCQPHPLLTQPLDSIYPASRLCSPSLWTPHPAFWSLLTFQLNAFFDVVSLLAELIRVAADIVFCFTSACMQAQANLELKVLRSHPPLGFRSKRPWELRSQKPWDSALTRCGTLYSRVYFPQAPSYRQRLRQHCHHPRSHIPGWQKKIRNSCHLPHPSNCPTLNVTATSFCDLSLNPNPLILTPFSWHWS